MQPVRSHLQFRYPLPCGAVLHDHGVQFVVFSRHARSMKLLLFDEVEDRDPAETIAFDPRQDRRGDIWSRFVPDLKAGQLYLLQADGPRDPGRGMRFQPEARLVDPWARALAGDFQSGGDGMVRPPRCVVVDDEFDWQGDRPLNRDFSETVIYEMHVRGFTRHPSSGVEHPGTFRGVIGKIPWLQSLGITAVELMPVHEFPRNEPDGGTSVQPNYWGYDPLALFAPHRGYAVSPVAGDQVREFREMVRELHRAGIEVILDVVFNHTCEGNDQGPVLSMKGLENTVYYMLEDEACHYRNYSGCGNTINGNHPVVREMIVDCLRHWVCNYHIDGFRFDLASILSRDRTGQLVANPPLLEAIAEDPLLADTKLIAEAWDAAGAYQVGEFGDARWAEWNGRFRDDVRNYWRGQAGSRGPFATRLAGSADLYEAAGRPPQCSINFVTSHDGFTMNDLVSYEEKHNQANGEENRDGENNNLSMNFGVEGETGEASIEEDRARQIRNLLTTLLVSQGVPMLVAGDESRRTQQGNNNAWCQDNEVSWLDWDLVSRHADLVRFVRELIRFRSRQPTLRRRAYLTGQPVAGRNCPDVAWYGVEGATIDWDSPELPLQCLLEGSGETGKHVFLQFNPTAQPVTLQIPGLVRQTTWNRFVDTAARAPADIHPNLDGPPLKGTAVSRPARSVAIYTGQAGTVI